jgi:DNA-binding NtrC family response regulator
LVKRILGDEWTVTPEAMRALEAYPWPGNVRQLVNALERAQIMSDNKLIDADALPSEIAGQQRPALRPAMGASTPPDGVFLADVQRTHILEILKRERGNKARTARALGVNRRSLYRLLEKYGIELPAEGAAGTGQTL